MCPRDSTRRRPARIPSTCPRRHRLSEAGPAAPRPPPRERAAAQPFGERFREGSGPPRAEVGGGELERVRWRQVQPSSSGEASSLSIPPPFPAASFPPCILPPAPPPPAPAGRFLLLPPSGLAPAPPLPPRPGRHSEPRGRPYLRPLRSVTAGAQARPRPPAASPRLSGPRSCSFYGPAAGALPGGPAPRLAGGGAQSALFTLGDCRPGSGSRPPHPQGLGGGGGECVRVGGGGVGV